MRRSTTTSRRHGWMTAAVAVVLAFGAAPVAQAAATPPSPIDVNLGGWIENALPLPGGDILVSNLTGNKIQRLTPATGTVTTVAQVASPGGLALRGDTLYVVTGNTPLAAITRVGGVLAINLTTGARRTLVSGLGEANGLGLLPDGDLAYTVTLGEGTGVHRLRPSTGSDRLLSTAVPSPNGLAVGPDGQAYVGSSVAGSITRIHPDTGAAVRVASGSAILDDFAFLPNGKVVAATILGFIDEIDVVTGAHRPLAGGFLGATSAKPTFDGRIVVSTVPGRVATIAAP